MTDEEETRTKLRQAARYEVYAYLIQMSDRVRGKAESAWNGGELEKAMTLRQRGDALRDAADSIRADFDIDRAAP